MTFVLAYLIFFVYLCTQIALWKLFARYQQLTEQAA